jgi:hypothetical protein
LRRLCNAGNGLVAFVDTSDGTAGIGVVAPDGTGQRQVTRPLAAVSQPAWSSDGRTVA